jgi:predicted RNA-binding protein with PUA-like domain
MAHWLMKSEPSELGIDDLKKSPQGTTAWDGVRNYQARNYMRDGMRKGDEVFFYHSNCDEPGIVGIARIVRQAYPDHTACDPKSHYYDPKARRDANPWLMVDVKFVRKLKRVITLAELKADPRLEDFALVRRGNRLSVMPVSDAQWRTILSLE